MLDCWYPINAHRGTEISMRLWVFLCWSSVCPNVPPLGSSRFGKIQGKMGLFCLAILMPEAVLFVAVGQFHRARKGRQALTAMDTTGSKVWTLRECFFINMGGLFIRFTDHETPQAAETPSQQNFPVNCQQLQFLVGSGHLELPTIAPEEIEARNSSDRMTRSITIIQVLWFTANTLARVVQGLHVTTLELTTLSLVLLMVFTAAAWWHKPMDISHPIIIPCNTPLGTILAEMDAPANPMSRAFGSTPLAFYDRREWVLSRCWASYLNILRCVATGFRTPPSREDRAKRLFPNCFPSIEIFEIDLIPDAFCGIMTQIYSCVFLAAWNAYFPTSLEKTLWRVSTVAGISFGFIGCAIAVLDRYGKSMQHLVGNLWRAARMKFGRTQQGRKATVLREQRRGQRSEAKTERRVGINWLQIFSNLSPYEDPELEMKLRVWIPATLLCLAYCFARAFIIVEDFISLRSQSSSTYKTVDWSQNFGFL